MFERRRKNKRIVFVGVFIVVTRVVGVVVIVVSCAWCIVGEEIGGMC